MVLPRAAAFWLVAAALFLMLFASGAASPLYGVYQAQWRFSATTLTAVFAVYVLALLLTLLVFGSLSDYLGRRRVIAVALAAGAAACALFLAAHGVGLLFAARALQGAAAGLATSAAGAALIDLQPDRSERGPVVTSAAVLLGLGAGGLGTSALVQYAPAPTRLVWWLLLGASAVVRRRRAGDPGDRGGAPRRRVLAAAARGRAAPGTRDARRGPARHDRGARAQWLLPVPGPVTGRTGAPLAGPCVGRAGDLPGRRDGGRGFGRVPRRRQPRGHAGRLSGPARRRRDDTCRDRNGIGGRVPGRTAVAGAGVGTGFFAGAYRVLTALAGPGQRAGLVAAIWVVFYLAFSVPVVAAGVATTHFGLHQTAVVYSAALAVLAAAAAGSLIIRRRSRLARASDTGLMEGSRFQCLYARGVACWRA